MLAKRLADARQQTDSLFEIVKPEALYDRPVAERHRVIFYLGHLEAFDSNLLRGGPQSELDKLFAFGIDPVGGGLPTDQPRDWPSIKEIHEYNRKIRSSVDAMPIDEQMWNVAIEHRLMHAETLAYMLHQMSIETKVPQISSTLSARAVQPGMVTIPAGRVTLGLSGGFGWDNEFDAHEVEVGEFQIDRYKVTNGDYLNFIRAGGYEDESLKWLTDRGIKHPVFWKNE